MTTPQHPGEPSGDSSPTQPVTFQPAPPEGAPAPPVVPVRAETRQSSGTTRLLNLALGAAVLVAAAGIAFAVGRATGPAQAASVNGFANGNGGFGGPPNGSFDPNGRPFANGEFPGGGASGGGRGGVFGFGGAISLSGTVDSVTADSITIRTASGQTVTVGLDATTTYHQQAAATSGDVQAGKTVTLQLQPRIRGNGNGNGGTGNGGAGNGNGNGGGAGQALGSATDVTIVP